MPVQIGTQTHSFSDPTGLLSDCHRRIETFLATLGVVAAKLDRPASEETRRALGTALKYFGHAAPRKTRCFPGFAGTNTPNFNSPCRNLTSWRRSTGSQHPCMPKWKI